MTTTLTSLEPNGDNAVESLPIEITQDSITSKGFAEGAGCFFDWFNDRLQIVIHSGLDDEPAINIRFNRNGSIAEIIVEDCYWKQVMRVPVEPSEWQKERDNHLQVIPALKLTTEMHATNVLHVKVPKELADTFQDEIDYLQPDSQHQALRDGITGLSPEMLRDGFDNGEDWDPDFSIFIEAVLALEPEPDEYFFHL